MPPTVREKMDSRKRSTGSNASVELLYDVEGTDSDAAAKAALEATAPDSWDDLKRRNCSVEPVRITGDGKGLWTGTVRYERPEKSSEPPQTGDHVITFDTSGGTQHVTQSISTVHKYAPPGKIAPDFKGAVGVTHDSVDGCDIVVPTFKFTVTAYVADEDVTPTYVGKLYALTGKVNDDDFTVVGFGSFDAGELLFLGSAATQRGDGSDWEIQWHFAASPNKTGITIGDIQNIEKKGWEYLWVRYEDTDDGDAKSIVKRPTAVYIEKVYDEGDFGDLEP